MCPEDELYVEKLLDNESVLLKEKVRFEVGIGNKLHKARILSTNTRLLLYVHTPMGLQLTVARYANVDHLTSGKRKKKPYVQLLGDASRILLIFGSKNKRDIFRRFCEARIRSIDTSSS